MDIKGEASASLFVFAKLTSPSMESKYFRRYVYGMDYQLGEEAGYVGCAYIYRHYHCDCLGG